MSIIEKILIGIVASLVIGILDRFLNYVFGKKDNIPIFFKASIRIMVLIICLVILIFIVGRVQPRVSIYPASIQATYPQQTGLKMVGEFGGCTNKHIYLLARQISNADKEVWTVTNEVVSINNDCMTWDARLNLEKLYGEVKVGDLYGAIALIAKRILKLGDHFETSKLREIKIALSEVLEIKIEEVSNE